jgi:hypothetical protein
MKRFTGSSRWVSGVGLVGVGVLAVTLGIGVTSALASDSKTSATQAVAQPSAERAGAADTGTKATVAGAAARHTAQAITSVAAKSVAVAEKKAPSAKTKAPLTRTKASETGTKAPAAGKKAPAAGKKAPAAKAKAPAGKATTAKPAKSLSPVQRLEKLARDVARPSGGVVTVTYRDENVPAVGVLVETAEGRFFELTVGFSDDADGVQTARQSCRNDNRDPGSGRVCTTLRSTPDLGVWSRDYSTQQGRQALELVATARDDMSLSVKFTNYVETPDGSKEVGPSWKDAGITVSGLRKAVVRSGLTVVQS